MSDLSRREVLGTIGTLAAASAGLAGSKARADEKAKVILVADEAKGFTLPPLPYAYNALEPSIDELTMKIHHDKHHKAYVDNLNKALADHPELLKLSIDELLMKINEVPESIRTAVNNNGGGHSNHSIFWTVMGPGGGGDPEGDLADAIKSTFGDSKTLKEKMTDAGMKRFGSGWSWLIIDKDGKLAVESYANQDSPYTKGAKPIFGVDVWEHAYYLKYQNMRADYLKAWWNVVNWKAVGERYAKLKG